MKTPLPVKIDLTEMSDESALLAAMLNTINKYHDYLAELTEVVNANKLHSVEMMSFRPATLKETLLGEIGILKKDEVKWKKAKYDVKSVDAVLYNRALSDVEAIINRLMP